LWNVLKGQIPGWRGLLTWYERNLPDEHKTSGARIVHSDYKLNNLVFHPMENRVIGILIWELCMQAIQPTQLFTRGAEDRVPYCSWRI
jgi:aminoglycoside phosphotransferase (APT) family kinase protein